MTQELDIDQQHESKEEKYHRPNTIAPRRKWRIIAGAGLVLFAVILYMNQEMLDGKFRNWAERAGLKHIGWFYVGEGTADWVKQMNSTEQDDILYKLSRWEAFEDYRQWTLFVKHGYEPLGVPSDKQFTYMEIGVGVGAWMRTFLRAFPLATGAGIDYEQSAIDVANVVLPTSQIKVQRLNMFDVPETFKDRQFDFVFIPGTLCYAESFAKLTGLIEGLITHRVIKSGGKMSVTMINYSGSSTGSCITGVEKEYWSSTPGWKLIEIQNMDDWKLPHSFGRYAAYVQADY